MDQVLCWKVWDTKYPKISPSKILMCAEKWSRKVNDNCLWDQVCFIEEGETNMYWVSSMCIFHMISPKRQYLKKMYFNSNSNLFILFIARIQVYHFMLPSIPICPNSIVNITHLWFFLLSRFYLYFLGIFVFNFLCIGVQPINNVVIVSGGQQGTQRHIYMYPFSPTLPFHLGCHILNTAPCAIL